LLRRVGDAIEALQLDAFLSNRVVLPVTASTDANTIHGEGARVASCRAHTMALRLDDLGDSELSEVEEQRRAAAVREEEAIASAMRELGPTAGSSREKRKKTV
jgi:hypothetical protein